MNSQVSLSVGLDLPFSVSVSVVAPSRLLQVVVEAVHSLEEVNLRRIEAHIQVFVACALYGMGGGAATLPRFGSNLDVTSVLTVYDRYPNPASASYDADGIIIDLSYLSVLFHKLYCLANQFVPLASVAVLAPVAEIPEAEIRIERGERSDLPEVFREIPFTYEADLESCSQSLTVSVEFERELQASESAILSKACRTWLAQCLQGGFVSPTYNLHTFFIAASDDPLIAGSLFRWTLDKVQVDPRAINGLTNLFVAFSRRFVRVSTLLIE